jgi:hypothetical protein
VQTIEEAAKSSLWLNHAGLRAILVVSIHSQNCDIPDIVNQQMDEVEHRQMLSVWSSNSLLKSALEGRVSRKAQESEGDAPRHVLNNSMDSSSYIRFIWIAFR